VKLTTGTAKAGKVQLELSGITKKTNLQAVEEKSNKQYLY